MVYTKDELEKLTKKNLLVIAKELKIVGRHEMRKEELINAINNCNNDKKEEKKNDFMPLIGRVVNGKLDLVGELVAYKVDGVLTTGKIKKYNIENNTINVFSVENVKRKTHKVELKDIVWFKLGKRWPKFVYNELKHKK